MKLTWRDPGGEEVEIGWGKTISSSLLFPLKYSGEEKFAQNPEGRIFYRQDLGPSPPHPMKASGLHTEEQSLRLPGPTARPNESPTSLE